MDKTTKIRLNSNKPEYSFNIVAFMIQYVLLSYCVSLDSSLYICRNNFCRIIFIGFLSQQFPIYVIVNSIHSLYDTIENTFWKHSATQ